jgi:hypothetical protein
MTEYRDVFPRGQPIAAHAWLAHLGERDLGLLHGSMIPTIGAERNTLASGVTIAHRYRHFGFTIA